MFTAVGRQPFNAREAKLVLVIISGMALMVTYVETMVLPAIEQFSQFFGNSPLSTVAWILSAYLLVGVIATPIFGRLGDIYGKKRMLLVAMGIYAAAVTVAGFSPNIGAAFGLSRASQIYVLIGFRAVQGLGVGMFPLAYAMLPEVYPAARVGQAQGVLSAMFAGGAALGLVGGGYIAQDFGWQLTYHTVIPIAIVLVILAALMIPESPFRLKEPVDLPGISSLGFGLSMLMFGLTEGADWGWSSFSAAALGPIPWGVPQFFLLALLGFGVFVWWERRTAFPVVRFAALKVRNILVSNIGALFVGIVMFISFTVDTILIEYPFGPGFGQSELSMGLITLPSVIGMLVTGPFLGRAVSTRGPRPIMLLGFALMALGGLGLLFLHSTILELVILPIPIMIGLVASLIAMSNVIVLGVKQEELGIQTGMNQTFRNIGSAIAPVLVTSVLASYLVVYSTPGGPVVGYAPAGFVVCFAAIAGLGLIGFFVSLALRNYRYSADGSRAIDTGRVRSAAGEAHVAGAPASEIVTARP